MKVKICGLKNEDDIAYVNKYEADFAGFVLFPKSKRNVSIDTAIKLKQKLNNGIKSVAVTVSPDKTLIDEVEKAGFDIIQIHGEISDDILDKINILIWRAINVTADTAEKVKLHPKVKAVVVDGEKYGGGKTFDWSKDFDTYNVPLILAGGLNASNVAEGIKRFRPYAVDVSSGVEKPDGNGKDEKLIKDFIERAKG